MVYEVSTTVLASSRLARAWRRDGLRLGRSARKAAIIRNPFDSTRPYVGIALNPVSGNKTSLGRHTVELAPRVVSSCSGSSGDRLGGQRDGLGVAQICLKLCDHDPCLNGHQLDANESDTNERVNNNTLVQDPVDNFSEAAVSKALVNSHVFDFQN